MQSPHSQSSELFFVLNDLAKHFDRHLVRMEPMSLATESAQFTSITLFYRQENDLGLACVGFHSGSQSESSRQHLVQLATDGGFSVIDPEQLSEVDRSFFYQDYLRRYTVRATDQVSPSSALILLGQQLGLVKRSPRGLPRTKSEFDDNYAANTVTSKHRRRRKRLGSELPALPPTEAPMSAFVSERSPSQQEDLFQQIGLGPAGNISRQAKGKDRRSPRMSTIPANPTARAGQKRHLALPPDVQAIPTPPEAPRKRRISTAPLVNNTGEQDLIRVRYQRGDSWMPARLRNLTTKDIRLAASAAPPAGSTLRVSVTIGEHNAVLTGTVVEVVNTEGSVDGSTSFRLEFRKVGKREHERLVTLLRKANRSGMSLTPPPARRNRRFAISWPVAVQSQGQRFQGAAMDISEHGLFLATNTLVRSNQLMFGMPLDRPCLTIKGRASVVRKVSEHMARSRGLSLGYGLFIEDFSVKDSKQYSKFVTRIRRRSQHHVVVVGEGERSQTLASSFQSVGYAVSQASTVEVMRHRMQFETSPPDIAVLDDANVSIKERIIFEATFRENNVPMLDVGNQPPIIARSNLDNMVSV